MRSLALPVLGWALLIGGLTEALVNQEATVPGSIGDRTLYYSLTTDQSVGLRLGPEDQSLTLQALLEVPQPSSTEESQTWLYGVQVSIIPPDSDPTVQTFWLRSRRSLLANGGDRIRGAARGRVVTDSRRVELELAGLASRGGLLRVTPILEDPEQTLLLRVERNSRAPALDVATYLADTHLMEERTERRTSVLWAALEAEERVRVAGSKTEPLGAEHLSGGTRALHRLGPAHAVPTSNPLGDNLQPGESTQLTLQGPCRLHVRTQDEAGTDLYIEPLRTIILGNHPPEEDSDTATPKSAQGGPLEIPPGALWNLQWTAPPDGDGVQIRFRSEPGQACVWGETSGQEGQTHITPETRRFTAWRLQPNDVPLSVPVATGKEFGHLVVEARALPPGNWTPLAGNPPPEDAPRVSYEIVGDHDVVLAEGAFDAPFRQDSLLHRIEPAREAMSEATRVQVLHPYRATTIRFRSDAPVDLRFLVPMDVERVRSSAYELPKGWEPNHAPWELAPYVSIPPANAEALVESHQLVRFDATVGPRPVQPSSAPGAWKTSAIAPQVAGESHLISEPVKRVRRIWRDWERTRLEPENTLLVPPHGRISIDYRVNPLFAGRPISLTCGETTVVSHLPAAAATVRFDGLPSGEQNCQLSAPLGRYLADVPGDGRRWARRRVYRADGRTLRVRVPVPQGGTSLFVRTYTLQNAEHPSLEVRVDDGRPNRIWGLVERVTPAIIRYQPPPRGSKAWLEDRSSGSLVPRRALYIPLGDDLEPGTHEVTLTLPASKKPVFVRFDSGSTPEPQDTQDAHWEMDGR
ncbi:MAG: hypothetical protein VX519_05575 [Myxococcota bacterium]|nr:hypothetical protein [Myxococcota bacterium]